MIIVAESERSFAKNIYAWTDSMIVMDWIQGNPRKLESYSQPNY